MKMADIRELLLLLEPSPMIIDCWIFLKVSEFVLLSSPTLPEPESPNLKDKLSLSTNSPKLHPLERMYFSSEVPETEKLKDISVFILVKRILTLLLVSDAKVENGKEPEEEDDDQLYLNTYLQINYLYSCF